jgi:hypothetical protein
MPSLIISQPSQNHHHDHFTITTISSTTIILLLPLPSLKNILHVKYFLSLKYFMQNKLTLKNKDKDINKGLRIKERLKHNCFFFFVNIYFTLKENQAYFENITLIFVRKTSISTFN